MPGPDPVVGVVRLRYWAAAKAAVGTAEEPFEAAAVATLADLVAAAVAAHPDDGTLARVLARCSYLVDGNPVGTRSHA